MSIGEQIHVADGVTADGDGLSFGASYHLPATDAKPGPVIVSLWDGKSSERDFELSVGEALDFADQTWRLDEIDDSGPRWYAILTRTA